MAIRSEWETAAVVTTRPPRDDHFLAGRIGAQRIERREGESRNAGAIRLSRLHRIAHENLSCFTKTRVEYDAEGVLQSRMQLQKIQHLVGAIDIATHRKGQD